LNPESIGWSREAKISVKPPDPPRETGALGLGSGIGSGFDTGESSLRNSCVTLSFGPDCEAGSNGTSSVPIRATGSCIGGV
jgi:hypothetical protein